MSECWHYIRFGTISDGIITGMHCIYFAGQAVLVPGDRVSLGHADLLERAARLHRPADDAHSQVLLLDREPAGSHGHRT